MERKLASIVRISNIEPIPNAESIEVATVKGWKVVVGKNDFTVGDLAVYYEIDSFLPIAPEFEFLRARCYRKLEDGREGFRLRTIKLRGQISQGLLTPVPTKFANLSEGTDLTTELNVVKYEPPVPANLAGEVRGLFPSFIPKTDEERVQNIVVDSNVIDQDAYITEKLDGSSFTAYIFDDDFGICSRNLNLKQSDSNAFWQAEKLLNLREKFVSLGRNIALQGELVGPGVQGNLYSLDTRTVYFFTGYDIDSGQRMGFAELKELLMKLNLKMVPVLEQNCMLPNQNFVQRMLDYADGKSRLNPHVNREGVVVRGLNNNFSFKAISNKYLLRDVS